MNDGGCAVIGRFVGRHPDLAAAVAETLAAAGEVRRARAEALPPLSRLPSRPLPSRPLPPALLDAVAELEVAVDAEPARAVAAASRLALELARARAGRHDFTPRRVSRSPAARAALFAALGVFARAFRRLETAARESGVRRLPWQLELATHLAPGAPVRTLELDGYELPLAPALRRAWGERCCLSTTAWTTDSHLVPALRYRSLESAYHTLSPAAFAVVQRIRAALGPLAAGSPEAAARLLRAFPFLAHAGCEETASPTFARLGLLDFPSLAVSLHNVLTAYGARPLFGARGGSGFCWRLASEVRRRALALARGLERLGLVAGDALGLVAHHGAPELWEADFAAVFAGLVAVPLPATLPPDELAALARAAGVRATVRQPSAGGGGWLVVGPGEGAAAPRHELEALVAEAGVAEAGVAAGGLAGWRSASGIGIDTPIVYGDAEGEAFAATAGIGADREADLYAVLFTSGSTGTPKGAPVTRRRWAEEMVLEAEVWPLVGASFLPPWTAADRAGVWRAVAHGGRVGFVGGPAALAGDLELLRPTVLDAPPLVWSLLSAPARRALERPELAPGEAAAARGGFRRRLGGRLGFAATGGAPTDPALREAVSSLLGVPLHDGYGTTETGNVALDGRLVAGLEHRLLPVPELDLGELDPRPGDPPLPRGELAVRTPRTVARHLEAGGETAAGFTADGYFRTGDLVELAPGGRIRVLGRRAHTLDTAAAVAVAPERLEQLYGRSALVDAVFVAASPERPAVVAAVVPSSPEVDAEAVLRDFRGIARRAGLAAAEIPVGVVLDPRSEDGAHPWSVENGLLTPSLKPRRSALAARYAERLEAVRAAAEARSASASEPAEAGEAVLPRLVRMVAALLARPPAEVDAERSFRDQGGDSLAALELGIRLDEVFPAHRGGDGGAPAGLVDLPLSVLAERLASGGGGSAGAAAASGRERRALPRAGATREPALAPQALDPQALDPHATAALASADALDLRRPDRLPPRAAGGDVLVTGASGFLGAHLVAQLARQAAEGAGGGRVVALVRAADAAAATARLRAALGRYDLGSPATDPASGLVVALAGSVEAPRLGLAERAWDRLAAETGVVYHLAAQVAFEPSYAALRPTNVGGLVRILELATTARAKPLVFVSSLNVALLCGPAPGQPAAEDAPLPERLTAETVAASLGYAISKWVAERLVDELFRHFAGAWPALVCRPALLAWSAATGIANPDDWLTRVLSTCLALRCRIGPDEAGLCRWAPETEVSARGLDLVPVDFAARALARLGGRLEVGELAGAGAAAPRFHLSNTAPGAGGLVTLEHLMDRLLAADLALHPDLPPLEPLPFAEWATRAEVAGSPAASLLPRLRRGWPGHPRTPAARFAAQSTEACPPFDEVSMERFVGWAGRLTQP